MSKGSSRASILGSSALIRCRRLTSLLWPVGQVLPTPQGGALHTPQASTWSQTHQQTWVCRYGRWALTWGRLVPSQTQDSGNPATRHSAKAWHTENVERKFCVEGSFQHLQCSCPSSLLRPGCRRGTMTRSRQHFYEYSLAFLICLISGEEKDSPVGFESFNLGMTSFLLPSLPKTPPSCWSFIRALSPTDKYLVTSQARIHLCRPGWEVVGCGLVKPKEMCTVAFVWLGLGAR